MSNIEVIDINEEVKQEAPVEEPIEEAKEEVNEVVEEAPPQEEKVVEEEKEEANEQFKPVKAQDKLVRCPKCFKEMKLKSLRYGHQQKCQGTLEQKPVKQFSQPRAMPKPKAQPIQQEEEIEEVIQQQKPKLTPPKGVERSNDVKLTEFHKLRDLTQPVSNQILKPQTPNLVDIASHYQLLQQQFMQQKKEKYNNLCQNMFAPKSKQR